jgi:hypothetical protein
MWLLLMKPITSPAQVRKRRVTALARIACPLARAWRAAMRGSPIPPHATIVAISVPSNTPSARFIDVGSLAYSALCWTLADAIMGQ